MVDSRRPDEKSDISRHLRDRLCHRHLVAAWIHRSPESKQCYWHLLLLQGGGCFKTDVASPPPWGKWNRVIELNAPPTSLSLSLPFLHQAWGSQRVLLTKAPELTGFSFPSSLQGNVFSGPRDRMVSNTGTGCGPCSSGGHDTAGKTGSYCSNSKGCEEFSREMQVVTEGGPQQALCASPKKDVCMDFQKQGVRRT